DLESGPMLDEEGKPVRDFEYPPDRLRAMGLGDLDGDGDVEIAVILGGSGLGDLLIVDNPLSDRPSFTTLLRGAAGSTLVATDLTGDGIADLAVTTPMSTSYLTLFRAQP